MRLCQELQTKYHCRFQNTEGRFLHLHIPPMARIELVEKSQPSQMFEKPLPVSMYIGFIHKRNEGRQHDGI